MKRIKKIIFLFVSILTIINCSLAKETEGYKQEAELKAKNNLTFRAKKTNLWLNKSLELTKDKDDTVEISLPGELYSLPKKISDVTKDAVDRSTLEGAVASIYSANEKGDVRWIVDNFVDEEKDEIKKVFKDKPVLKDSKLDANNIVSKYITGHANYKDYTIIFIEQEYKSGRKIVEALPCIETSNGWKTTNALLRDTTFDVVFAAVADGEVFDNKKLEAKVDKK